MSDRSVELITLRLHAQGVTVELSLTRIEWLHLLGGFAAWVHSAEARVHDFDVNMRVR